MNWRQRIEQLERVLSNLLRDSLATDFNEHWDSYQQAQAALAGEERKS